MSGDSPSSFPLEQLLTAVNSVAILLGAIVAWWANRNRKTASAINTQKINETAQAVAAVHEVAKDLNPPEMVQIAAEKAVRALPGKSTNLDNYRNP